MSTFPEKIHGKFSEKFQLSPLGRKRRNVQAEYCVIKGTVAREGKTSMVVYWKEQKRKRRKRTAHSFNNFPPPLLQLLKYNKKCGSLEKKDRNCHVVTDSCWSILPCLLLADGLISRIFHHTQPIGKFPERVSFYIWVFFSVFPVLF